MRHHPLLLLGLIAFTACDREPLPSRYQFPNEISALGNGPITTENYAGIERPASLQAVENVVAQGKEIIPDLRKAVASHNPVLVGHAILCLWKLNFYEARIQAKQQLDYFRNEPKTPANNFAVVSLRWYLRVTSQPR